MEKLLGPEIIKQLNDVFAKLDQPVRIVFFGGEDNCELCDETRQLLHEVADVSPEMITVAEHDIQVDADMAKKYGIDKTPMFIIGGDDNGELVDYGIRFSGIPAGHEFATLVTTILDVSMRTPQLDKASLDFLAGLKEPVHMMVFVTPT